MRLIGWCALALLAGCGGGGDAPGSEAAPDTGMPGAMMPTDTAMMDSMNPPMGQDSGSAMGMHVGLNAVGGSGASGMAMTTPENDRVAIEVSVSGAPASESLAAHLHRGRCGNDQGVAAPLDPVNTAEGGGGTATTRIDAAMLRTGEHFVQVHGPGGAPILCGDLPIEGS